jgi:hypothetical protein
MKWSIYAFMVIMFAAYWMTGKPKAKNVIPKLNSNFEIQFH